MNAQFRPILFVIGIILIILSVTMGVPMVLDWMLGDKNWMVFFKSLLITLFTGITMVLMTRDENFHLSVRQTFILTTFSWLVVGFFASLPLHFSTLELSFTNAIFESVSGITTTGATVITGLESVPRGLLLWRAMLQWIGGIGVIVMALSVLPFLKVGGMQLFRTEFSEDEKTLPRTAIFAMQLALIYFGLTFICTICYGIAGMTFFDAVCHAMTTLSTGGFSTSDSSIGYFQQTDIEIVSIIFMIAGCSPFVLFVRMVNGDTKALFRDKQVHGLLLILTCAVVLIALYLNQVGYQLAEAVRLSAFNVTSILSGTGYVTSDYSQWSTFAILIFFFLTMVGGCAGSATCGIKVFRFQILAQIAKTQLRKLVYPHGIFRPKYNGKTISQEVASSVAGFFFMYVLCMVTVTLLLSITGLDLITSLSGAATTLSNVGPGLGEIIGPAGTFQSLPDVTKWVMTISMLMGRLELYTVLVLFTPAFWQN